MVSVRSATWTVVLVELVLSCAMLIASLAVASAQAQSTDMHNNKLSPTLPVIVTCLLSFCLMTSAIFAMFGLSGHRPGFLLSHIFFSVSFFFTFTVLIALIMVPFQGSSLDISRDFDSKLAR